MPGRIPSASQAACSTETLHQTQVERILRKYASAGPRYTSYPTADRFVEAFSATDFDAALSRFSSAPVLMRQDVQLYVHVPFCQQVCYYCACNKIITKHLDRGDAYVRLLHSEIKLVGRHIGLRPRAGSLHFGGGTPSFLGDAALSELIDHLREYFDFDAHTELAIELDPRTVDASRVRKLVGLGFKRLSFGVQDFDENVQKAVHRVQSVFQVRTLMEAARNGGARSINLDLIYGLPLQTIASFEATLEEVIRLRPDRIALYAYAHLPERFPPQRRIHALQLPDAALRVSLLSAAIARFSEAGYAYLGMDHFALACDEMALAHMAGRLRRNFQGYTAHPGSNLIGLGVSAISSLGSVYSQNAKTLDLYEQSLGMGVLPVERGVSLSLDDELRWQVIQSIMCAGRLDCGSFEETYLIDFESYFASELAQLVRFVEDGLLTREEQDFIVTKEGWLVVRAIAAVFDRYLQANKTRQHYSRIL
jgi:oxygen-independent coproporphyrinogen III oxidase